MGDGRSGGIEDRVGSRGSDFYLLAMRLHPFDDVLSAQTSRVVSGFVEHCVRNDDIDIHIQQIVERLRRSECDQRSGIDYEELEITRHSLGTSIHERVRAAPRDRRSGRAATAGRLRSGAEARHHRWRRRGDGATPGRTSRRENTLRERKSLRRPCGATRTKRLSYTPTHWRVGKKLAF